MDPSWIHRQCHVDNSRLHWARAWNLVVLGKFAPQVYAAMSDLQARLPAITQAQASRNQQLLGVHRSAVIPPSSDSPAGETRGGVGSWCWSG